MVTEKANFFTSFMDVPRLRYNCFLANNRQGSRQYVIANYSFIHDTPCRQNELAGKGTILHSDIPKEVTFLSDGVILNVGSAL